MTRRIGVVALAVAAVAVCPCAPGLDRFPVFAQPAPALPDRLSDAEFWTLVADLSESGGAFHSDNFTSNEPNVGDLVAQLAGAAPHGGAYLGVGPEQNFNYIVAIRPHISFIVDIRRQAVMQHLLYKAIFELASDRADFISLLFSQPRPDGLDTQASISATWAAFPSTPGADSSRYQKNLAAIEADLVKTRGFSISDTDRSALEYVYQAFFTLGPAINYAGYASRLSTANTNFAKLTSIADSQGTLRSFLATDASFQYVKDAEARNLIVPIEGDFAGPHAIRAIGTYLRVHGAVVRAFYVSNVEQYLFNPRIGVAPGGLEVNGGWQAFYANVEALPLDASSVFIRPPFGTANVVIRRTNPDGSIQTLRKTAQPLCPIVDFLAGVHAGRITVLQDANACGG